jgi:hypothetical protein
MTKDNKQKHKNIAHAIKVKELTLHSIDFSNKSESKAKINTSSKKSGNEGGFTASYPSPTAYVKDAELLPLEKTV